MFSSLFYIDFPISVQSWLLQSAINTPRKSPCSQGREGGCGKTTLTGKQAHIHEEKQWNLWRLQKQSEHRSTYFNHGHVFLGIEKGTLSFRAFLQTTSSTFILSELLLAFAAFLGLGIILGKHILQRRDRGTPCLDWNAREVLYGVKSVSFCFFWQDGKALPTMVSLSWQDVRVAKAPMASHTRQGSRAPNSMKSLKEMVNQIPCLRGN